MAKMPNDYELEFLKGCTDEELEPLVGAVLGTDDEGNINLAGRFSSQLNKTTAFKKNYPEHSKYVDELIEEIQRFGGNSFANIIRGTGVSYHELLCDVAKKTKVNFNRMQKTELIESYLLAKTLEDAWGKMSEDDKKEILKDAGNVFNMGSGGLSSAVLIKIFQAGGIKSYQMALIIVNAISKAILGHGLKFAGNIALVRWLSVLAGPIGWIVTGIWTAVDFASPAYRVTIPACIYIAALRTMKANEKFAEEGANEIEDEK